MRSSLNPSAEAKLNQMVKDRPDDFIQATITKENKVSEAFFKKYKKNPYNKKGQQHIQEVIPETRQEIEVREYKEKIYNKSIKTKESLQAEIEKDFIKTWTVQDEIELGQNRFYKMTGQAEECGYCKTLRYVKNPNEVYWFRRCINPTCTQSKGGLNFYS